MAYYKVINILQDGTRLDSMEGFVLPKEFSDKVFAVFQRSAEEREIEKQKENFKKVD
ncbi:hypothetical protein CAR_c09110 [Carnobacterium sp. 17-4]|uniref:BOW99_gp33 family protein n=1 Tax=Carnobacterium sp. (strain 17-4) TaxID=208596 RepID=UPI0002058DB4|nr:hypothetical protein [Carnobacterium sp. 17-4]AEB29604.1 hypothetical protein CAR_c09110 [Carnobacterium sp. 17-4]